MSDPWSFIDLPLGDGRWASVDPLTFGRARINVRPSEKAMVLLDGY